MADGRMLKKAISTSRRLADLKTDSARMLYTWIIPHLDIEGRFYADAAMVKGSVVPRIKSFTESKIEECLHDMASVGLIILYQVDGDRYLQLRKFEDHQNIRKDREAPSSIPEPILDSSGITPGVVQDQSGNTPIEVKIREDKRREGKAKKSLPPDFEISDAVKKWAAKKGYTNLGDHLESFKAKCSANGYQYIDWDAAFMEAIRADWARIRTSGGNGNGKPGYGKPPDGPRISEYKPDPDDIPAISEEERRANLAKLQAFTPGQGKNPFSQ